MNNSVNLNSSLFFEKSNKPICSPIINSNNSFCYYSPTETKKTNKFKPLHPSLFFQNDDEEQIVNISNDLINLDIIDNLNASDDEIFNNSFILSKNKSEKEIFNENDIFKELKCPNFGEEIIVKKKKSNNFINKISLFKDLKNDIEMTDTCTVKRQKSYSPIVSLNMDSQEFSQYINSSCSQNEDQKLYDYSFNYDEFIKDNQNKKTNKLNSSFILPTF